MTKGFGFTLIGDFNAYNLTAAYATAVLLGEDPEQTLTTLSGLGAVPGRFEKVKADAGLSPLWTMPTPQMH